ncbi:MAG: ABC transporter substrate-binding protein [Reyranella sp.]|nr:ABC transporter substrate-binding protein [Reyranella sp.]MBL6653017.1 ABC transporter substrate-binding protein [Reyranella sp.]
MRRREVTALLSGGVATMLPWTARTQQREVVRRIGIIFSSAESDPQSQKDLKALKSALQTLGWDEGHNLQIDYRWAGGDLDRARSSAIELVKLSPAVIVGSGTLALTALHAATKVVPVVFLNVTDPVAGGFVASLSRPGGNITGFTPFEYDIGGKWLELLKDIAPELNRAAMLGDPNNHNFKGFQRSFEAAAKVLAVEPIVVPVRAVDDLRDGIQSLAEKPNGGLVVTAATFSIVHRKEIVEMANKKKLPTIFWNRSQAVEGGLMSFGPDSIDLNRRAASYVDRILKGENPADLPVQGPTKYELIVNMRTAREIKLVVPPTLLARADEVIE